MEEQVVPTIGKGRYYHQTVIPDKSLHQLGCQFLRHSPSKELAIIRNRAVKDKTRIVTRQRSDFQNKEKSRKGLNYLRSKVYCAVNTQPALETMYQ